MPTPENFRLTLLLIALAGVALLFARAWPARLAGAILMTPRLFIGRLHTEDLLILGAAAAIGVLLVNQPVRKPGPESPPPETPEPDDVSEPAPCPSCRGIIPAGADRCPRCGWTYLE
jgi:hypothetical protein